jgi:hypothetical protein
MLTRTPGGVVDARLCGCALTALLAALGSQSAYAQGSEAVTVDVGRCTHLESPDARLACFGAQVDAVLEERGQTEAGERTAAIEDGDTGRETRRSDERSNGREEQRERPAERGSSDDQRASGTAEEAAEDEYSGTIVAMRERLPNAYVITLDNGQVWEQAEPKQFPLRPGLEVRIYPTRWGSNYRLNGIGTGGHIQVRKVQ